MSRNLPHIAGLAFNQLIALEPAYARVFYSVLASEMGVGRLIDGVSGDVLDAEDMRQEASLYRSSHASSDEIARRRPYQVVDGIAIVPVSGTLTHKLGGMQPYSGMTGYDGILSRIGFAINQDPEVRGVLVDFDTPGGQVSGAFDAADMITRMKVEKPIWSLGYDMHCSAGQLLSAACSHRLITQTGVAGSVGVITAHTNMEKLMKNEGVEITLIYSGDHKADGNPYEALPSDVKSDIQTRLDSTRQLFAQKVADSIGMDVQKVLDTEARTFTGQDAVDVGFADEVVNGSDAVAIMIEHLDAQGSTIVDMGASMTKETNQSKAATPNAAATEQTAETPVDATTIATAERERVMGIIGCDEAKGREAMAQQLASMPHMSLNDAKALLGSAPKANTDVSAADEALAAIAAEHGESLAPDTNSPEATDDQAAVSMLLGRK